MKVFPLGLRTRLLIAFALVSAFTGAAVAAGSYLQVRDPVLTAAQDRMQVAHQRQTGDHRTGNLGRLGSTE